MIEQTTSTQRKIQEWVSRYGDELYRWALHKTSDRESAEDIVQETFLAVCKSIDKFQGKSQPKTWLFSILNNKIMDYHRKKFREATDNLSKLNGLQNSTKVMETFFDSNGKWRPANSPENWQELEEHLLDNPEFNTVMKNCMKKLPTNWFSAIHLKYLEEKSGKIICQELGITPTNFWQILHRAKIQLRACIEKKWFKA